MEVKWVCKYCNCVNHAELSDKMQCPICNAYRTDEPLLSYRMTESASLTSEQEGGGKLTVRTKDPHTSLTQRRKDGKTGGILKTAPCAEWEILRCPDESPGAYLTAALSEDSAAGLSLREKLKSLMSFPSLAGWDIKTSPEESPQAYVIAVPVEGSESGS